MPRQKAQANFNSFVGGLNTEAGKLNFPENASIDERNFVLDKNGSRRRRLGMALSGQLIGTDGSVGGLGG